MKAMIRSLRIPALAVAVAGLAACGGLLDSGDGVSGTYSLERVNGETPPVIVYDSVEDGNHIRGSVADGRLVLDEGTFTLEIDVEVTWDGVPFPFDPLQETGSYEVDGSTIRFRPDGTGGEATGTVDGEEITVSQSDDDFGTFTLLFRR